jgi:hypothetical protein
MLLGPFADKHLAFLAATLGRWAPTKSNRRSATTKGPLRTPTTPAHHKVSVPWPFYTARFPKVRTGHPISIIELSVGAHLTLSTLNSVIRTL